MRRERSLQQLPHSDQGTIHSTVSQWGAKRWILFGTWVSCCMLVVVLLFTEVQFLPALRACVHTSCQERCWGNKVYELCHRRQCSRHAGCMRMQRDQPQKSLPCSKTMVCKHMYALYRAWHNGTASVTLNGCTDIYPTKRFVRRHGVIAKSASAPCPSE